MRLILAFAAAAMLTTPTLAAPCRGAKGKFVKCPPAAAAGSAGMAGVVKDKTGRCHWSATENGHTKGAFTKCP